MSAPLLNVSLTINPGRGCHYLPKPRPGQAFLSEEKEGGNEGAKKSQKKEVPLVSSRSYVRPLCHTKAITLRFLEIISKHCVLQIVSDTCIL